MTNWIEQIKQALEYAKQEPKSRESALVITHLETALLWAMYGTNVTATAQKAS